MKIDLRIDSFIYSINTRDPETLARWLIEHFDSIEWTPATWCTVSAWPSFSADGTDADWLQDTRFLYDFQGIKTPEDFVKALGERLAEKRSFSER